MKMEPPDTHYFYAAQGWLGLGVPAEALAELEQISAGLREIPDVLEVRWQILAATRNWEACLAVAHTLVDRAPDEPRAWAHRSVSLYRLQRTEEAFDALAPALSHFPRDWVVRYDLACYACQLDRLTLARTWLAESLQLGDATHIRQMALEDPDLELLWPEIPGM